CSFCFCFNAAATTKTYTLSLHDALPISSEDRAGETTSPVTEPLPLKNPKISSVSVFTGSSFATGSPCLVITTVSRLALTSTMMRSEEHTSELQSLAYIVCRLLLEKKNLE